MAVTQGLCRSFRLESLQAIHAFGVDTFSLALYDRVAATLGKSTTVYTPTGEISGVGYVAGGKALTVSAGYPLIASDESAEVRFDDLLWTGSTFSAGAALVYNASKANRAVCVLDFGSTRSVTNGTFKVTVPLTVPAVIRLIEG